MKAKVTSHDQIDEITMSEDEVVIRVPQGQITIKADNVNTQIQYKAQNPRLSAIDTRMKLERFDNFSGSRSFTIHLTSPTPIVPKQE